MWSPIKHSLLVRRLGKNPHDQSSAFLSPKDEEQAGRSVGRNIQRIHLWQSKSGWTSPAGRVVVAVCPLEVPSWHDLLPCPPTAHCLFPLGFWHRFILCSNIWNIQRKIAAQRSYVETREMVASSRSIAHLCHQSWVSHGSVPTKAPRPLGLYLVKLGLAAPCWMGLRPAHADTGWIPGLP